MFNLNINLHCFFLKTLGNIKQDFFFWTKINSFLWNHTIPEIRFNSLCYVGILWISAEDHTLGPITFSLHLYPGALWSWPSYSTNLMSACLSVFCGMCVKTSYLTSLSQNLFFHNIKNQSGWYFQSLVLFSNSNKMSGYRLHSHILCILFIANHSWYVMFFSQHIEYFFCES